MDSSQGTQVEDCTISTSHIDEAPFLIFQTKRKKKRRNKQRTLVGTWSIRRHRAERVFQVKTFLAQVDIYFVPSTP